MRKAFLTLMSVSILVFSFSFGKALDSQQTCFDSLRTISPQLSNDRECVVRKAGESFLKLCGADGVHFTKEFQIYLMLRDRHLAVKKEAEEWVKANPGATQYSSELSAKLKRSEDSWTAAGKKNLIEENIEKTRRVSVSCQL